MKVLPTLRQLRFLVAFDDRRHFGQAAKVCFVSQSTLSAAIKELEDGLGVILFDRTRRSVAPTGIGLEIAERARAILRHTEDLVDIALGARDPLSGPLRLGVTLVPEMAIASGVLAGLDLHVAPLKGDRPWRRIALVWRKSSGRKETFRRLAGLLRAAAGATAETGELRIGA
jgi:DNA-binding transcriptional LysR family regulator